MAKRRVQWGRLGAGVVGAGVAARAAGVAAGPGEAERLKALVANESRHLSLHDVQVSSDAISAMQPRLPAIHIRFSINT